MKLSDLITKIALFKTSRNVRMVEGKSRVKLGKNHWNFKDVIGTEGLGGWESRLKNV